MKPILCRFRAYFVPGFPRPTKSSIAVASILDDDGLVRRRRGINDGVGRRMAEFEVNGVALTVPDDFLTRRISEKLGSGGYEGQEADSVRRRLRPGWRVLELGSGIGYVASVCAGITGA